MLNFRTILRRRAAILLILAGLAVAAGLVINQGTNDFVVPTAIGETNESLQSEDFQYLERANRAFINLVAKTRSSIVQITTERKISQPVPRVQVIPPNGMDRELRRFYNEDWLEELFRNSTPNNPRPPIPVKGVGSGVIVSDDGYILTNNHVIEGADKITVTLANGKEYDAELVGRDSALENGGGTDLAVIKIHANELSVLPFGDSDALEVGEWVIAIGTPHNLSQTVTRGIVSAKERPGFTAYGKFIQTDAPINRGNSGGALINIRGELVGINTYIAIDGFTRGNIGLGFAIPSNLARQILPELIENGEIARGWLGISMREVNHDLAEKFGLDSTQGVLVIEVGPDSPAEKAGLRRGDIILEYNKEAIQDMSHLRNSVGSTAVGTSVQLKILRNGKKKQLTAKLEKRTEEALETLLPPDAPDPEIIFPEQEQEHETEAFAGMRVQKLTPQLSRRYMHQNETGVIIMKVELDSPAAKKGIQRGYLIKEIDYKPIENLKDYEKIIKELKENGEKFAFVYFKDLSNRGHYATLRINPDDR
jgi:serine protease Do